MAAGLPRSGIVTPAATCQPPWLISSRRAEASGIAAMGVIIAQGIAFVAAGAAPELAVSARWPGRRLR